MQGAWEVFRIFLKLGLMSFGGPVAHLGFFREEFVARRRWLSEAAYADLVALCQFLPGPASSQTGFALGYLRAGLSGAVAAWIGFTLPSAIIMFTAAVGIRQANGDDGVLQGLKIAALAVVAQAVWTMASRLCTDSARRIMALSAAPIALLAPSWMQIALIVAGLAIGAGLLRGGAVRTEPIASVPRKSTSTFCLALFLALLGMLPLLALTGNLWLEIADRFYRAGALVFGGGHVVLPLLEAGTARWVSHTDFLAGYGVVQAVPGPLFSFAAYLGALIAAPAWLSATLALLAIYLPSLLLVLGALPHWQRLRNLPRAQGALDGANAVVVGILLAALIDPIGTSTLTSPISVALAIGAFAALQFARIPPWLLVLTCALAGMWLLPD